MLSADSTLCNLRWLPLRAEQRKQMSIGIAEICRPHRAGDITRLLAKLYTLIFQRLVRRPDVIHRKNHLSRTCQRRNVLCQRLTQDDSQRATVEEGKAWNSLPNVDAQPIPVKRHGFFKISYSQHDHADRGKVESLARHTDLQKRLVLREQL